MPEHAIEAELLHGAEEVYTAGQQQAQRAQDLSGGFKNRVAQLTSGKEKRCVKVDIASFKKIGIAVLAALLAFFIYTMVDLYGSGTQTVYHKLRVRNDTSFVLSNGSDFEGHVGYPFGVDDMQYLFDPTEFEKVRATGFYMTTTPLGIVADLPSNPDLRLHFLYRKEPTQADFGGKMNILVKNPKRRRMYFTESWFNTGYWKDSDMLRDYSTVDEKIVLGQYYDNDEKIYVPNAFSNKSITPVWMLDFTKLKDVENYIQMHPDGFVFNLNPLVFRNYNGGVVTFEATQFEGVLAIDTPGPLKIECNHCNVSRMMVNQDQTVVLNNFSVMSQIFKNYHHLYGIVGQFDEEFYYRRFELRYQKTISIYVLSDIPLALEQTKSTIILLGTHRDELLGVQSYTLSHAGASCNVTYSPEANAFAISCQFDE